MRRSCTAAWSFAGAQAGEKLTHSRRRRAHPRRRGRGDRRRFRRHLARRCHGRREHRGRAGDHRRRARSRRLGPARGVPDLAPPQAAPVEASKRFERVVDPAITIAALDRAATLLAEIAGGTDRIRAHRHPRCPWSRSRRSRWTSTCPTASPASPTRAAPPRAGWPRSAAASRSGQRRRARPALVTPPSWRPDLVQPADLVEEVLRLEGLEQIPSVLPHRTRRPRADRRSSASPRGRAGHWRSPAYVEVPPPVFLPAGVFDVWGLDADDPRRNTTQGAQPARSRPSRTGDHVAAGTAGEWPSATSPAASATCHLRHRAGGTARRRHPAGRGAAGGSSPDRRADRRALKLAAGPAGARRRGAQRLARAARAVGAGPCGRGRRRLRAGRRHRRRGRSRHRTPMPPSTCRGIPAAAPNCSSTVSSSRRPRRHQQGGLSRARPGVLRRRGQGLWRRAALARRGRLHLRADGRHQPRLPVRREDARGRAPARRRSERAAAPLCASSSTRWWRRSRRA